MKDINECAAAVPPVDLYGLRLLQLVAERRSITAAAAPAGLSQSALTRQVQLMEERLGVRLFHRTTRRLSLTDAGRAFLTDAAPAMDAMQKALARLRNEHIEVPKLVRIGLSRSIALAHLPGLLHAHLRRSGGVRTTVAHADMREVLERVGAGSLDIGVCCPPRRLVHEVRVTHRMEDPFVLIAPASLALPPVKGRAAAVQARLGEFLRKQTWLTFSPGTETGRRLDAWLTEQGLGGGQSMELDNFDMITHLVAIGMGVAMVPRRALAAFPRRKSIQRVPLTQPFVRELAVIVRAGSPPPAHVSEFVRNVLFS